jgi:long-chain fatty acid transport protein
VQPVGLRTDRARIDYPLPLILRLGTMVRLHERVMIALDYNFQRWHSFDRLTVQFAHHYELQPTPGAFMYDVVLPQRWHDSHTVRLATEFFPADPVRVPLRIRAGALFDQSPIPSRTFDVLAPDSDKLGLSAGLGYTFVLGRRAELAADLAFMHLFLRERDIKPQSLGATDTMGGNAIVQPGSDKTILNKPAPSFYQGITRARFEILSLGLTLRV